MVRTGRGRNERRVVWCGSRVRERSFEGTIIVSAFGRKTRVVEWNSKSVAVFGSVDVSVIAVMRNELMEFSEGNANEEFERSFHDNEVKEEVENDRVFRRV